MFDIGERISIRNKSSDEVSLGTIRFVGSLSGKEGTWVGVEWDDPHRGKHDGSFDGIRYFQCQYEPASASFLNANKVHRGSTLTDAFRERYQRRDNDLKDMTIETSGHRHMAVTLRGEESIHKRMSDLQSLQSATMHCADISIPGCIGTLQAILPNLQYLGLSNNLLWCWEHVHEVVINLQSLSVLDVSFNRLQFMRNPRDLQSCAHLCTLVANGCWSTWHDIEALGAVFTGLQELYMGANLVTSIGPNIQKQPHCFNSLKVLDLTDNKMEGWHSVSYLSNLSNLSCLKLSGNSLNSVSLSGEMLQNIQTLLVADCGISDWASVSALGRLSQLKELRLTGNPVLQLSSLTGRNECIARLAVITQLNGAAISAHERRDCELQYLYRVQQRIADLGPAGPAEAELHPRLEELRALHGDMAIQPRQAHVAADASLGERLLALDFVCRGVDEDSSTKECIHLPCSTTIALVKMLCAQCFGLDVNLQRLLLHSGTRAGEEIGEDNSLDISYWNLQTGDVIEVCEHEDAEKVWKRFAGFEDESVPEHWLLPPELRLELAEITQAA